MRALILAGCFLLAACNKDQAAETGPGDANVVSGDFSGNDVTAIDAATNDDANMAADAEISFNETNLPAEANSAETSEEGGNTL